MRSVQQHLLPQSAAGPLSFPSVLVAPLVYSQDRSLLLPASDPARVAQRLGSCRTTPPERSLGGAAIGAGFLLLIVAAWTVP